MDDDFDAWLDQYRADLKRQLDQLDARSAAIPPAAYDHPLLIAQIASARRTLKRWIEELDDIKLFRHA